MPIAGEMGSGPAGPDLGPSAGGTGPWCPGGTLLPVCVCVCVCVEGGGCNCFFFFFLCVCVCVGGGGGGRAKPSVCLVFSLASRLSQVSACARYNGLLEWKGGGTSATTACVPVIRCWLALHPDIHVLLCRVVPACYRRCFPAHLKSHRSHDIVLLCVDCHQVGAVEQGAGGGGDCYT
jgi:hypothetical protein